MDLKTLANKIRVLEDGVIVEDLGDAIIVKKESFGPKILFIEPTLRCNLSCIMCFRRSMKESFGDMKTELFEKILDDASECGVEFIWFGGWGEPLAHPKILDFIEKAKEAGFGVGINTNGTLLTPKIAEKLIELGVERIVVSSDAATYETYARIRGFKYTKILEALDLIKKVKEERQSRKPMVNFLFTSMANNIGELPDILYLAKKYGVALVIVSNVIPTTEMMVDSAIYTNHKVRDLVDEVVDKLAKATFDTGVRVLLPKFELKTERRCLFIENNATVITWDGNVVPCYNFLHTYTSYIFGLKKEIKQVSFGNIGEEKLCDIWWKDEYVKFRWKVKHFAFPSCPDCELRKSCSLRETNEVDCWGNQPSCAECLYGRGITQCMI